MSFHNISYRFRSVNEITPEILREIGVTGIAVDLDNTLVFDGTIKFFKNSGEWVESIKAAGIPIVILSNAIGLRVLFLAKKLGVDYIAMARKPSPKAVYKAAKRLGVDVAQLGMVGDQIFADVEAANRAGAIPLLVDPKAPEVFFKKHFTEIRKKEKVLLEKFNKEVGYYVDKRKA
ncbi:MAG: Phosphoglycolate phosphatase [Firmicutes bacterium ADurb.Bin300]|nr:MAG: Phosphoglycolate phosphatase [Firmicutes bacterium ADurb.Bin300]HOD03353.1 YqeG family HAD IIIA-type phosphatase [Clostridiales bacterium]